MLAQQIQSTVYLLLNDSTLDIAHSYFIDNGYTILAARAFRNRGRIWAGLSNTEDALNYYYSSLDLLRNEDQGILRSTIYSEIGDIYFETFMFDDALSMYEKSYMEDSICVNIDNMVFSLGKIGKTYLLLDRIEEGYSFFEKSRNLARESNDSIKLLSYIYGCYSVYHSLAKEDDLSLFYISKSIQYSDSNEIEHKYLTKGELYIAINEYDSARFYLNKSVTSKDIFTETASYNCLYELELSLKNYESAIFFLNKYQIGVDSIITLNQRRETEKTAYKYNVEKAVLEINSINKTRLSLLGVFFSVVILSLLILFILHDKKRKLKQKAKENEILANEKEIIKKEKEIANLNHKMDLIKKNLSVYEGMENEFCLYKKEKKVKRDELFALLREDTNSYCNDFKKLPIYTKIKYLSDQKRDKSRIILTYPEQDILTAEINRIFSRLIESLNKSYPALTGDDIKLCCLSLLKLSTYNISLCFTVSGVNAIKQRKHRIKSKMTDFSGDSLLYDFIFSELKKK